MIPLAVLSAAALSGAQPVMLAPGTISTRANEFGGTISPDGREIYYSVSVQHSYMYAIYYSRRGPDGRWGKPMLAPFSGHGRDFDPVFSPDGKTLLFISDRSAGHESKLDYDIWRVERRKDGSWSGPTRFGSPINTVASSADDPRGTEEFASIASDGTLYFAGDPRDGSQGMAIWEAKLVRGRYETPRLLPKLINSGRFVGEPIIAPDQSFLLFSAFGLPGGFGNWDIYISRRDAQGRWTAPENLGAKVNTPQLDYSPRLAPDGHTLIFTSERFFGTKRASLDWNAIKHGLDSLENGQGNIYEIDLRTLRLKAPGTKANTQPNER